MEGEWSSSYILHGNKCSRTCFNITNGNRHEKWVLSKTLIYIKKLALIYNTRMPQNWCGINQCMYVKPYNQWIFASSIPYSILKIFFIKMIQACLNFEQ